MNTKNQFIDFLDLALNIIEQISRADVMDSYAIICYELTTQLAWDYSEVWIRESKHVGLTSTEIYCATDKLTETFAKVEKSEMLVKGEGFPGLAWKYKKPIWFSNILMHPEFQRKTEAEKASLKTCVSIPILVEDYIDGVLLCFSKSDLEENVELMKYMSILGYYIGRELLKKQLDLINNPTFCSEDQSVEIISKIFNARDPYTTIHESSVKELSMKLADSMQFTDKEKHDLRIASSLHDIGKIAIPMEILSKPASLSKVEHELVKTHVSIGYNLIRDLSYSQEVKRMVLEHHERNDGSGYPCGKKEDEIYIGSQLLAIADVVSAMLENRPYRIAHSKQTVIDEIYKNSGTKYNKEISEHAIRLIKLEMKNPRKT